MADGSVGVWIGNDLDLALQLILRMSGDALVSEETAKEIRLLAREHFEQPVQVRLITRSESGVELHYHW